MPAWLLIERKTGFVPLSFFQVMEIFRSASARLPNLPVWIETCTYQGLVGASHARTAVRRSPLSVWVGTSVTQTVGHRLASAIDVRTQNENIRRNYVIRHESVRGL